MPVALNCFVYKVSPVTVVIPANSAVLVTVKNPTVIFVNWSEPIPVKLEPSP